MADLKYDKEITALLVIDPYNDFISDGGKLWDRVKTVGSGPGVELATYVVEKGKPLVVIVK
jgi:hypothetical protein